MDRSRSEISDGERVVRVAAQLDVSEFEVFRRAYVERFGRAAAALTLERDFAHYMYFGSTPPWVRRFTCARLDAGDRAPRRAARNLGLTPALMRLMDGPAPAGRRG